jgi:hypothetical protein
LSDGRDDSCLKKPDADIEKKPKENIKDIVLKIMRSALIDRYYPAVSIPDSTLQYAVCWSITLSETPLKQMKSIESSLLLFDSFSQQSVLQGLVKGIRNRYSDFDEITIRDCLQHCLKKGHRAVRKLTYAMGWELFGTPFVKSGLDDPDTSVRKEAMKLANKPATGILGREIRQQTLF